ncbi:hypothetical protein H8A97_40695 [Bradyrhizobium sp. Arg62]|uniref:hypothetical protein n=1 Tax=Bradyrhizobium brasilense TaxID=1419277 RepID=UPI001E62F2B7|nr:hypothetical protein [Bradyrhizobium brasilense]MCC8951202.1 hypothetical protein [Bradyrhizobium brasilense]
MPDDGAAQLGRRELVAVVKLPDVERQQTHRLGVRGQRPVQHVLGIADQQCQRLARERETDETARRDRDHHVADLRARFPARPAPGPSSMSRPRCDARALPLVMIVSTRSSLPSSCSRGRAILRLLHAQDPIPSPGSSRTLVGMERADAQWLRIELHDHPPDLLAKDRQAVALAEIRGREPKPGDIRRLHRHRLILMAAGGGR